MLENIKDQTYVCSFLVVTNVQKQLFLHQVRTKKQINVQEGGNNICMYRSYKVNGCANLYKKPAIPYFLEKLGTAREVVENK